MALSSYCLHPLYIGSVRCALVWFGSLGFGSILLRFDTCTQQGGSYCPCCNLCAVPAAACQFPVRSNDSEILISVHKLKAKVRLKSKVSECVSFFRCVYLSLSRSFFLSVSLYLYLSLSFCLSLILSVFVFVITAFDGRKPPLVYLNGRVLGFGLPT